MQFIFLHFSTKQISNNLSSNPLSKAFSLVCIASNSHVKKNSIAAVSTTGRHKCNIRWLRKSLCNRLCSFQSLDLDLSCETKRLRECNCWLWKYIGFLFFCYLLRNLWQLCWWAWQLLLHLQIWWFVLLYLAHLSLQCISVFQHFTKRLASARLRKHIPSWILNG